MRIIETALVYDQVQGAELACLELVARTAQLVELRHWGRVVGGHQGTPDEDAFLYMGTGRTRGLLAVAPELEAYVAGELGKETVALKERRKAREERNETSGAKGASKGK